MRVPVFALIWSVWLLVLISAAVLTMRFNKQDSARWKAIKFLGVAVATIPIIGLVQGFAVRSKAPAYAQACLWQAGVGLAAYVAIQLILR